MMQLVDESGPNVKSSSTMIAIYPPMNFRRDMSRFADPDIGVEGLHQTLVYLGKLSLDEFDRAQQLLSALVRELPPIDMKVNGVGMFFNAKLVPYVTLSGVGLDVMRAKILMAFNGAKLKGVCSHGGVPHMTLGYYEDVYDDWWRMVLEEGEIDFNFRCSTIHLVRGDRVHIPFKLTGSLSVEGNPNIPM
jgi:2'-5' RNA ligase